MQVTSLGVLFSDGGSSADGAESTERSAGRDEASGVVEAVALITLGGHGGVIDVTAKLSANRLLDGVVGASGSPATRELLLADGVASIQGVEASILLLVSLLESASSPGSQAQVLHERSGGLVAALGVTGVGDGERLSISGAFSNVRAADGVALFHLSIGKLEDISNFVTDAIGSEFLIAKLSASGLICCNHERTRRTKTLRINETKTNKKDKTRPRDLQRWRQWPRWQRWQ